MKRKIHFLIFLGLSIGAITLVKPSAGDQNNPLLRNLAIILDTGEKKIASAVALEFLIALCQKASPILIHAHTLEIFAQKNDPSFSAIKEKIHKAFLESDFYKSGGGSGNYFLIVPHEYSEQYAKSFPNFSVAERIGFDIENPKLFTKMSYEDFGNMSLAPKAPAINVDEISKLFFMTKKGLWQIYLSGHGTAVKPQNELKMLFEHRKHSDPFDLEKFYVKIAGFNVYEFRKLVIFLETINTNFFYYKSCYAGGYNLLLPYVANLFIKQFVSEEEAAGIWPHLAPEKRPQTIPHVMSSIKIDGEERKRFKPNFTIVVGSSVDAVVSAHHVVDFTCLQKGVPGKPGHLDFINFFSALKEKTELALAALHDIKPVRFSSSELETILQYVTEYTTGLGDSLFFRGLPHVMFPNTGVFVIFPVIQKSQFVIPFVKIKAAQIEHKPIVIPENEDIKAIILPVADMPVELVLSAEKMPPLISLLPGIGIHIIDGLEAKKVSFSDFVGSFGFIDMAFQKYFFIKKVIVRNDAHGPVGLGENLVIYDVLIASYKTNVRMFFTDDKKYTYFTAAHLFDATKQGMWIQTIKLKEDVLQLTQFRLPGSDDFMPNYLMTLRSATELVEKEFKEWNTPPFRGRITIAPQNSDKELFGPLVAIYLEQWTKQLRIDARVKRQRNQLEEEKKKKEESLTVKQAV